MDMERPLKISRRRKLPHPGNRWAQLKTMQPGDTFFTPTISSNVIRYYQNTYGGRFTRRTVTEGGKKGIRVWCLEPCKENGRA